MYLAVASVALTFAAVRQSALVHAQSTSVQTTCQQIASSISSASYVYYPADPQYQQDIAHYAKSSTEESICSVEPGTTGDVGIILQILGATQTPFAVSRAVVTS